LLLPRGSTVAKSRPGAARAGRGVSLRVAPCYASNRLHPTTPVTAQPDLDAILADASRPQQDRDADAGRHPKEVIAFFGVERGDNVADLLTGGGYWTRILVPLVAPAGRVYAGNNPFFDEYFKEAFDALLAEPAFANVVPIDGAVDRVALPAEASLDAVIMVNA